MEFTAQQIAGILNGTIDGDPSAAVSNLSKIEEGQPGTLTFLANPKYTDYIYTTGASIAIVARDFTAEKELPSQLTLIRVDEPYSCFAKLLEVYNQVRGDKKGIEQPSFIDPTATLGEDVYIGAFAYVGKNVKIGKGTKIYPQCWLGDNVTIGDNTTIYAGVKIYHDCKIGNQVTVHASTVIGADGFGFAPNSENNYAKVPQIGNVVVEDLVEIGSNVSIDRATLGSTYIRKGVKIDNLIQIAHNVDIGENTVIAAQTGVAGSTKLGKNMMVGGQVGIIGHLKIADGVKIAAQSGIGQNIDTPDSIVQGSPAFSIGDYKRSYVLFRSLPQLKEQISNLAKELKALKQDPNQ
ncbi:MAG: UDP-3-O-(3-hydroxymyristoyl)glucosamine N-acyltransferase [Flavobacteriales bacterium]|nr:UDP-3-O-(3-hydroxymyristoyl)glucosamine N-acyltransferase [Flavobacteriales bacterium]